MTSSVRTAAINVRGSRAHARIAEENAAAVPASTHCRSSMATTAGPSCVARLIRARTAAATRPVTSESTGFLSPSATCTARRCATGSFAIQLRGSSSTKLASPAQATSASARVNPRRMMRVCRGAASSSAASSRRGLPDAGLADDHDPAGSWRSVAPRSSDCRPLRLPPDEIMSAGHGFIVGVVRCADEGRGRPRARVWPLMQGQALRKLRRFTSTTRAIEMPTAHHW